MNMGDVFAFFGLLLMLAIALPGMLLTWWLLLPRTVERARQRLIQTPGRCFGLGLAWLAVAAPIIAVLFNVPAAGWFGVGVMLALASLGTAGVAALMGSRLLDAGASPSRFGAFVRGAIALELAVIVPVIGWFVFFPIITVCSLGAAGFALLRWNPRTTTPAITPEMSHAPHTS